MEISGLGGAFAQQRAHVVFPIVASAVGNSERKLHTEIGMLMSPALWQDLVPIANHNLEAVSTAFRVLSCLDTTVYSALTFPHKRFPVRLFGLLGPDRAAIAEQIETMPPCLLCPFSRSFVEKAASDGGLLSELSLAKLRLLAILIRNDTAAIEAKHAALRRRLNTRGIQTHSENVQEISAEFLLDQLRLHGQRWVVRAADHPTGGEEQAAEEPSDNHDGRVGGPWRAFLRQHGGSGGLPDMKALAAKYRSLTEAEREQYAQIGIAATEGGQASASEGTSFGPTARQLQRAEMQQRTRAQAQALQPIVAAEEVQHGSRGEACEKAVEEAIVQHRGDNDLSNMVKAATRSMRGVASEERRQREEALKALADWQGTTGRELAGRFVENVPPSAPLSGDLVGATFSGGHCLRYQPNVERLGAMGRLVASSGHSSNLAACLERDWADKHLTIFHHECPVIPDTGDTDSRPTSSSTRPMACWEVGSCICGEEGRALGKLREQFYRKVKATYSASSGDRHFLTERFVVAEVHGQRALTEGAWARAVALSQGCDAEEKNETFWLHFGFVSLSPYEIGFKKMDFRSREERLGCAEVHLQEFSGFGTPTHISWFA